MALPAEEYAIQYTAIATKHMPSGHAGLVFPPLFLTMVFCFALVLMQQHHTNTQTAAASQEAYNKPRTELSPPSLKTITPLQPITIAQPSSATAGPPAAIKTSAPAQPSKASGSAVQGAGQNNLPVQISVPSTLDKAKGRLGL